jgi:hypothetical protein
MKETFGKLDTWREPLFLGVASITTYHGHHTWPLLLGALASYFT